MNAQLRVQLFGRCGCGRPVRYTVMDANKKEVGACNKYLRCAEKPPTPVKEKGND